MLTAQPHLAAPDEKQVVGADAAFVPAFTEKRALPPNVIRANGDPDVARTPRIHAQVRIRMQPTRRETQIWA